MPVPPPPPPPPPGAPSLPSSLAVHAELPKHHRDEARGRSALFEDIHKGIQLKKVTQINDRSAPVIDKPKSRNAPEPVGGMAAPMGGLFQGGFPVLRPTGQKDTSERVSKPPAPAPHFGVKTQAPRYPVQNNSGRNERSTSNHSNCSEPIDVSKIQRALQGRLNVPTLAPPPLPVMPPCQSRSPLPSPPPVPAHSFNKPAKTALQSPLPPPPPPQSNKPTKFQYTQAPPSPPLPPPPPSHNFEDQTSDFLFPAPPPPIICTEDCTDFPPPPPPLPPSSSSVPHGRAESPLPPPPPPPPLLSNPEVPPPLPPKLPNFSNRPSAHSTSPLPPPLPSAPPYGYPGSVSSSGQASSTIQPSTREASSRSAVHNGGGKLASPPLPPSRSSSTEVTSRNQHSPGAIRTPLPPPPPPPPLPVKNRQGLASVPPPVYADDFEAKYNFHSVEDLPPPDEYKSFPRIYPSKQPRASQRGHRTTTPLR